MKRSLKNLLDRHALARIDRALDDGVPPTGWAAWYMSRNAELRDYYEQMLEMELELRFSDDATDSDKTIFIAPSFMHTASGKPFRHVPLTVAVVLLIALGITIAFVLPSRDTIQTAGTTEKVPKAPAEDEPSIDLAALFDGTPPLVEILPSLEKTFEAKEEDRDRRSALDDSVASIVRFTQQPLESTLQMLESAHIITRHNVDSGDL